MQRDKVAHVTGLTGASLSFLHIVSRTYINCRGSASFLFCDLSLSLKPKLRQQPHCGKQLIAEEWRRMETYPFSDNQKR